jgi:glycosyltransferase involved in cell wall biosynthesis
MDAMASRLPVVATAVGGIPEIVINNQTGILVPARNPQALAEAILKLYHDREFGRHLAQKGYDIVHQKFSAESMADRIIDVYEKIARRKGLRLKTTK